ncbi:M48 family metalloprotease [Rhabdochromatium marinum]|uniref:M48 family metalloprotease n=1 Tax=Rhabdochromatium marinum TaxID=48729 RepID=UPI001905FA04|nr:M48 family metalloprotease [Rhabdochromatium marinum]MBK1648203.1 peptidase M48 [Rhabdochromatium marinum]
MPTAPQKSADSRDYPKQTGAARHPWQATRLALGLLIALAVTDLSAEPYQLPDFGSSADTVLSLADQRALARAFMKSVRKALPVIEDPVLEDYIQALGQELVQKSDQTGHYHFFLIDQAAVNAFAGPSGQIGVFAGLVLAAETESELAAVLAHEIAHVSQKHLLRSFEAQKRLAMPATALLIAAALLGAQVDAQAGMAAMAGIQAMAVQSQINFTRDNEKEADRIGIEILAEAGHNPFAMPGFFESLGRSSRYYDNSAPEFLRTHPVTTSRIADALARAEGYGLRQRPDSLGFHLARANLRERSYSGAQRAVEHFESTLKQGRYRHELAERYGYALALLRAGRLEAARQQVTRLLKAHPGRVEFLVLEANIDRSNGQLERALRHLKSAYGLNPDSWPLAQAYGQALLQAGQAKAALAALEAFHRRRPSVTQVYGLLADAAGRSKQPAKTFGYRAEELYYQGDLEPAIRQLERAVRVANVEYHLASKLQARLDVLREEQASAKKKWSRGSD